MPYCITCIKHPSNDPREHCPATPNHDHPDSYDVPEEWSCEDYSKDPKYPDNYTPPNMKPLEEAKDAEVIIIDDDPDEETTESIPEEKEKETVAFEKAEPKKRGRKPGTVVSKSVAKRIAAQKGKGRKPKAKVEEPEPITIPDELPEIDSRHVGSAFEAEEENIDEQELVVPLKDQPVLLDEIISKLNTIVELRKIIMKPIKISIDFKIEN